MTTPEPGTCPKCGSDYIHIGPVLRCADCGHVFGFPAMVQADEICHYPRGHPLRKRKTDARDPHRIDVKRAELEAEAEARCKEMGHDMGPWTILWPVSACWCRVCKRTAVVNPYPRENDIEESGDALRNLCPRGRNT
jgi:hypothetical protein